MIVGLSAATLGMLYLTRITPESQYVTHVLPSEIVISVGMALVFIPAASTALVGVGGHDAGVASALLNTTQQVGGSLGTALLNTLYASAVTAFLAANATTPLGVKLLTPEALVHGYHVAFFWGAVLLFAALITTVVFIRARPEDLPADPAGASDVSAPTEPAPIAS